jgi:DNA-binding MarR family transcriptional regulator
MTDDVREILEQWATARPDLDTSPLGVFERLSRTSQLAETRLQKSFARHDLDAASFDVLATLRRNGPPYRMTPSQLQRSSMVTSSAVAQRLNRLEERGLIVRDANADDGRVVDVGLTDEGFRVIEEAVPDHFDNERQLLAGLTISQRKELALLLGQLFESMSVD